MQPVTASHIDSHPNKCGGKPCIAGTRIRVWDIHVWHDLQGMSAEQIVAEFPQLSLANVYATLAYYHENREEIQSQMRTAEERAQIMHAAQGPGLLDRLLKNKTPQGQAVKDDAVSP